MQIDTQLPEAKKVCIVAPGGKNVIGDIAKIYGDILEDEGICCIYIDSKPYLKFKMFFDLIKERKSYDCIHVHTSGFLGDVPLIWTYIASKLFSKRVIITYHCGSPDLILKKTSFIVNKFFNSADAITVPSNFSREVLLRYNKDISKKLFVLPNIVDVSKWRYSEQKKDTTMVLTVSSISKWYIYRKGLNLFVEAAKELPEFSFYIVGGYDDSINLLKEIAPPNLHFTGRVSDDELIKLYNSSSVYCQFSISESFGYALAEAMSCGCVPVVTRNASLPEVAGEVGYYIDNNDPKEAAEQIKRAANSNLSKRSRDRILKCFSAINVKRKLLDIVLGCR